RRPATGLSPNRRRRRQARFQAPCRTSVLQLGQVLAQLYRFLERSLHRLAHADVQRLDAQREGHGEVDVTLRHMHVERFGNQQGADHDQERQREDLQSRMLVDEVADGTGRQHHHHNRNDNRRHHHRHVVHQPNSGNHRVQREDDIDNRDLQDDADEAGLYRRTAVSLLFFLAFHAVPDFHGALEQQEQTTEEQDQIAPGNTLTQYGEQVASQSHDPGDRKQQQNARPHRQRQAEETRLGLLLFRQPADQDGDEDDVVDAKDDFQGSQSQKRDPDFRVAKPFHAGLLVGFRFD